MYFFVIILLSYLALLFILKAALPARLRQCPRCKRGILKRVPKMLNDRILNVLLFSVIKVKRYECEVCTLQVLRIKAARKKMGNSGLTLQG